MRTLDRYILRQLVIVTLIGVTSLTSLLLLGQLFKELQKLLVENGAPISLVLEFIIQVIPFSLTFSVPWGFLTAILLVYGRLAADNELTSMRMAGLSLWRLSLPAFFLGSILAALCYYINIQIAPSSKQAMSDIIVGAAIDNPKNLLGMSQNAVKIDKVQIYIESRQGDLIKGLHVYPTQEEAKGNKQLDFNAMHAEEATLINFDAHTRMLNFQLTNATIERSDDDTTTSIPLIQSMPLQVHIPNRNTRKLKANRFSNGEIHDTLQRYYHLATIDPSAMQRYKQHAEEQQSLPAAKSLWKQAQQQVQYYQNGFNKKTRISFETEGSKRASFACASLIFALIGVPLAITARRRDSTTGFALGILVAALYFLALVLCELTRKSTGPTPYIMLWLPNILGLIYGIYLHARAKYRG